MADSLLINENLIENNNNNLRDSQYINDRMDSFMESEQGKMIKADIELLKEMGFDKKMINKVYILLQPESIDRAIEYMSENNGLYQHNFFENYNSNKDQGLCFICKKTKRFHMDYIPEYLLVDNNQNNNFVNDIIQNENNYNNDYQNDSFNFRYISEEEDNNLINKDNIKIISNQCNICYDEILEENKKFNELPCGHVCCEQCWLNYFKTLIQEAKVDKIKCVEHNCNEIISEEFILKFINNNKKLVEKYNKFKKKAEIIKDKNKKQCPSPNCESFLEKSNISKYVKCENGHEYCFECLQKPHGKSKCDEVMEKAFLKWKKHKKVKRCPNCQIFTEKNEGCNHITYVNCKYQWCWLCEGKYSYGHYDRGNCEGHQFTKADSVKQANRKTCCISFHTILPCFFTRARPINFEYMWLRYVCILVFWLFGYFIFAGFSMARFTKDKIDLHGCEIVYYCSGFFIALFLLICFHILFTCLIAPFILIAIVYPYFLDNIAYFFNIGK